MRRVAFHTVAVQHSLIELKRKVVDVFVEESPAKHISDNIFVVS